MVQTVFQVLSFAWLLVNGILILRFVKGQIKQNDETLIAECRCTECGHTFSSKIGDLSNWYRQKTVKVSVLGNSKSNIREQYRSGYCPNCKAKRQLEIVNINDIGNKAIQKQMKGILPRVIILVAGMTVLGLIESIVQKIASLL